MKTQRNCWEEIREAMRDIVKAGDYPHPVLSYNEAKKRAEERMQAAIRDLKEAVKFEVAWEHGDLPTAHSPQECAGYTQKT